MKRNNLILLLTVLSVFFVLARYGVKLKLEMVQSEIFINVSFINSENNNRKRDTQGVPFISLALAERLVRDHFI